MKLETPTGVREVKPKSEVYSIAFLLGTTGEEMYNFTLSLTWALDRGRMSVPPFNRFTNGNDPVRFV
jgi:hypothetical protein